MPALDALKAALTRHHLAALLGYEPSTLSFIVYKIPPAERYNTFEIPKRGGGTRRIDAPVARLKFLQKALATLLYECSKDIEAKEGRKNRTSHAFRKQYSIITNAKAHKSHRYVLNLDLEGFFPSLHFGRVRGFFLNNNHFKLAEPIATTIAQIACNDGVLPQGSPCSPIISELITHFFDMRMVKLAAKHRCTYTRYADDITLSTSQRDFPAVFAVPNDGSWVLGEELRSRIEDAGFTVNDSKTRMQVRGSRQVVTGLVVNEKVNVAQRYYKLARAMTHSFVTSGKFTVDGVERKSVHRLEGILNHIYHVRERLLDLAIQREPNKERQDRLHDDRTKYKNEYPSGIRTIFYQLVFFKHFVDPQKPLVVCEGKSDAVYLKAAIRRLAANHPQLVAVENGKQQIKVNFFKYSEQSRDLLQLRGGAPDLKFFLESWKSKTEHYKFRPMKHPVIVLIDNDDGASGIFKLLGSKKFNVTVSLVSDAPFYHLDGPLYLVKTPTRGADHKSRPEDFFAPEVLATLLNGKRFNPDKEHDAPGEYGKVMFAEQVVRPKAATIDFSAFDPLLSRIDAVIQDYAARVAAAQG